MTGVSGQENVLFLFYGQELLKPAEILDPRADQDLERLGLFEWIVASSPTHTNSSFAPNCRS